MVRLTEMTRSGTRARQVLIWGNVVDSITSSSPISPVTVRLLDQATNEPYPLPGKVAEDGAFAFYGSPVSAFPVSPNPYLLRIEASAALYVKAVLDLPPFQVEIDPLRPQEPVPALVPRLEGLAEVDPVQVRVFENPPLALPLAKVTVEINPTPVFLRGRIVDAADPGRMLNGIDVRLFDPRNMSLALAVSTSIEGGRWVFVNPLPALTTVMVQAGTMTPVTYLIDYTQRVNELTIIV